MGIASRNLRLGVLAAAGLATGLAAASHFECVFGWKKLGKTDVVVPEAKDSKV